MAMFRALLSLTVTAILVELAIGANYTVGGASGWDVTSNFQAWAAAQSFHVGDNLIFKYSKPHNVLEVTKADYDSCQTGNALQAYSNLNTVITLTSPGKRYFTCGFPEHCGQGMKLQVDTLATSAATPTSSTGANSPSTLPKVAVPPVPQLGTSPSPSIATAPSTLPKVAIPPLPGTHPLIPPSMAPLRSLPLPGTQPLIPPSMAPLRSLPNALPPIHPHSQSFAAVPSGSASTTPPPPSPSSANKDHLLSKLRTGMWFGMSLLLAL